MSASTMPCQGPHPDHPMHNASWDQPAELPLRSFQSLSVSNAEMVRFLQRGISLDGGCFRLALEVLTARSGIFGTTYARHKKRDDTIRTT
jgi:hypothetical protein